MRKGRLLAITIVILLTILFHYTGWLNPVEVFFRKIINPGSSGIYQLSVEVNNETDNFGSVEELEAAYIELKKKYIDSVVDKTEYKLLEEENAVLREQLNFLESEDYKTIGATVVGKSIEPLRNSIIIDRGEADNIRVGMPVVAGSGIFIGKIIRVEEGTSVVNLINDRQSKIAGTLMNRDRSVGIIEGGYGLSIQMNFIPQNESVPIGETVITSGLEEGIPNGLVVGTVDAIEKEAYQPFQRAIISPAINLDKIKSVSVIIDI